MAQPTRQKMRVGPPSYSRRSLAGPGMVPRQPLPLTALPALELRGNVEAVKPDASRRACQISKMSFDSSVEVVCEPAGLLYRLAPMRANLWRDSNIGDVGHEEVRGAVRDQVGQDSLERCGSGIKLRERIRFSDGCENIVCAAP